MSRQEEKFMRRALQLAAYGLGTDSPNPMVGCVIVCRDRIIGEGFHHRYGEPHAEVNAVRSVLDHSAATQELMRSTGLTAEELLRESTVYVTLEPCSHYGKTPPCAKLLIETGVKKVVVCCGDPNPKVNGRGIKMLREAGIEVQEHFLEQEGRDLGKRFFTNQEKGRPYVILKWAQSADGFIAAKKGEPTLISNEFQQIQNHRYRAEEDAIMVGTGTLLSDNPRLNARLYYAEKQPLRISFDLHGRVLERLKEGIAQGKTPGEVLHFFDGSQPSLLFITEELLGEYGRAGVPARIHPLAEGVPSLMAEVLHFLHKEKIGSLIVEGGTELLQSFIDSGLYDEVRILESDKVLGTGYPAPTDYRKEPAPLCL